MPYSVHAPLARSVTKTLDDRLHVGRREAAAPFSISQREAEDSITNNNLTTKPMSRECCLTINTRPSDYAFRLQLFVVGVAEASDPRSSKWVAVPRLRYGIVSLTLSDSSLKVAMFLRCGLHSRDRWNCTARVSMSRCEHETRRPQPAQRPANR